jgi:hypothetical protein
LKSALGSKSKRQFSFEGRAVQCNPNIFASYLSTLCQRSAENLFTSFSVCYVFCIHQRLSRSYLVFNSHTRWFFEFTDYVKAMCYKEYNEILFNINYTIVPHTVYGDRGGTVVKVAGSIPDGVIGIFH